MLLRIGASLSIVLATTFGGVAALRPTEVAAAPAASASMRDEALPPDVGEVVRAFGDVLDELHVALSYERSARDERAVARACRRVTASYPTLRDTVGHDHLDLLVAAESMVDACRTGTALQLDAVAFEIVDGDFYTYRELSLSGTS